MVFGVKGPKSLLASAIANAMAEFFIADPTKIESNLLVDAKIVLNNVQLRPQTTMIQPNKDKEAIVVTTTGVVEQVAFTWAWSSFGGQDESWIKDATLTITGLKFKTQLSYGTSNQELDPTKKDERSGLEKESSQKLETIKKEGKLEAYAKNQVEQIIDALTLQVKEFEFTLALPDEDGKQGPEISVGGKSVELCSLGRMTDAQVGGKGALMQKLSFGSFCINVVISTTAEERSAYPLLSPLSYSAVATRISGKRFSSFGSGLEVVGGPLESSLDGDKGVVFHAGLTQIEVLSELGNILIAPATDDEQNSGEGDGKETNPSVQMSLEGGEDALKQSEDTFLALKKELLTSSVFQFLVPGISLVLPNETKCTLEDFTVNYQTDGTLMNIQGFDGAGILVDAYPLIRTNKGSPYTSDSHWTVDFVASVFSIGDQHGEIENASSGTVIAMIRCSPTIVAQLLQGMDQIMEATSHLNYASGTKPKIPPSKSDEESKWSLDIQKSIKVRLEDESQDAESQDDWIEMTLGSTFVTVPLGRGSEVRCEGFNLGPSSLGQMAIAVPPITMSVGQESLHFDGPVAALFESFTTFQNIQSFLLRFTAGVQASDKKPAEPSGDTQAMELPIGFTVPQIELDILEASVHVEMNQITATMSTVEINSINAHDSTGTTVSVAGFKTLLGLEDIELQLERVHTLNIPGVVTLTQPLLNTKLLYFENGTVSIRFKSFEGTLLPPKSEKDETSTKSNIVVPFPVNLFFEALTLTEKEEDQKKKEKVVIHMEKWELNVVPQSGNSGDSSADDTKDVKVVLNLGVAENYIMQLRSAKIEGFIDPNHSDEIRKLRVQVTEPVKICAGYSAIDWQGMFKRKEKETSKSEPILIKLPGVCIETLKLEISADFKVVAQTATEVEISPFQGDQNTTSNVLVGHYLKKVKKEAPGMITNTEVLGVNFVDTSVTTYGAYALRVGTYGGAIIGFATVVGVDGVKGGLKAGKKARGAGADEKYRLGDFARGLGYSISETSKSAAAKRRLRSRKGHHGDENLLDFAVGATAGTAEYVGENKAKLGGAGATGVGMVVGTMVGGPVGGIAGGILVGAATSKTIEGLERRFHKKSSSAAGDEEDSRNDQKNTLVKNQNKSNIKPPLAGEVLSNSIQERDKPFAKMPQGLLYKQRDMFFTQWRPRWFVLHLDSHVLAYHFLTANEPCLVDTNTFLPFNKSAAQKIDWEKDSVGFEPVPRGFVDLNDCQVAINDKLSDTSRNLYVFTLSPPENEKPWHLATASVEERLVWFGMLAEICGQTEDVEALIQE